MARIKNGLTMQELSDRLKCKVSKQAISRYERGGMRPSHEVLALLCNALSVNPAYFEKGRPINVSNFDYRRNTFIPIKEEYQIREIIRYRLESYIEIERLFGPLDKFDNPLTEFKVNDESQVEDAAEELIKAWDLGFNPLSCVCTQLEEFGVKVIEINVDPKFEGTSMFVDSQVPVIVVNTYPALSVEEKRFNVLRELGYLLLQSPNDNPYFLDKVCSRFARAMLLPKPSLLKSFENHRSNIAIFEIKVINQFYGISIQAILDRIRDFGLIGDRKMADLKTYFSARNKEVKPGNYKGEERALRYGRLLAKARAEGLIGGRDSIELSNLNPEIDSLRDTQNNDIIPDDMMSFGDDDDDDLDYGDVPLISVNPNYEGRGYSQT